MDKPNVVAASSTMAALAKAAVRILCLSFPLFSFRLQVLRKWQVMLVHAASCCVGMDTAQLNGLQGNRWEMALSLCSEARSPSDLRDCKSRTRITSFDPLINAHMFAIHLLQKT